MSVYLLGLVLDTLASNVFFGLPIGGCQDRLYHAPDDTPPDQRVWPYFPDAKLTANPAFNYLHHHPITLD